jgi:tetratricopeptide (TPR) repeat protein
LVALACVVSFVAGIGTKSSAQAPAQQPARVTGELRDVAGNLSPGVSVTFTNTTTSQVFDTITDGQGRFVRSGIPAGNYTVTLTFNGEVVYETIAVLAAGQEMILNINFKELQAQQEADQEAAARAAAEARAKFAAMKVRFDAGLAALEQAKATRMQMDRLPRDQRAPLQGEFTQSSGTAVTELSAALEGTTAANRGLVLARLGEAYELTEKYDDAIRTYQEAVTSKPDAPSYNNLGNSLARTGKVDDALAAYQKAIELDPTNTAVYWRNFAVGLYNSGRINESLDPLKKATAADPTNAQAWYLLGAALVNTMEFKTEGDRITPVMQPGTIEAYQKAIELDPGGPYAVQAQQGLEALQAMGIGIPTRQGQRPAPARPAPARR